MEYTNKQIAEFKNEFEATKEALSGMVNGRVLGNFSIGLCPQLQFIRIDALEPKDYPHGIAENSVYLDFSINYDEHKVELNGQGHTYLSKRDLTLPQYKYLAMKSMTQIAVDKGGKKFRKSTFKDGKDLTKKLAKYYNDVMKYVTEYTGGYPYKQGIEE